MKHAVSGLLCAAVFSLQGQIQVDQPIQLTGGSGQRSVQGLEAPVNATDAVNKEYVDNIVAGSGGGAPTMITDESAATMNFGAAIRYCHDLVEGGYSDWRLPTYTELIGTLSTGGIAVPNPNSSNYVFFQEPIPQGSSTILNQFRLSDGTFSGNSHWAAINGRVRCVR